MSEDRSPSPVRMASKSPKKSTPRKSPIRMEEPEQGEEDYTFADNEVNHCSMDKIHVIYNL